MNCLLCGSSFISGPSWKRLFLVELERAACDRCFRKFEKSTSPIDFSDFKGTMYEGAVDSVTSLYTYNEPMKSFLHQYKFLQDVALAQIFAEELQLLFRKKEGIIVPIPMHPEKLLLRTFAQVDELLKGASIPFQHLLTKMTKKEQGKKSKMERLKAESLFEVKGKVEGKNYILFDDIYTTGTTIHHAAQKLKETGAQRVDAITLIKG